MLRKLALSLAMAGLMSTSTAYALGLGEIKINSALNEPLDAEIELLEARKLNPLQIQPRMADIDDYVLAGIDKQRFLSDVAFKVVIGPDGNGRIRLTSRDPVKEPFLNFLVEVNWPNGRLVREYTLLLDPPAFDPSKLRATVQPAAPIVAQAVPAPAMDTQPAAPVKNIRTEMDTKRQVFVDVHDSLWSIADKYRPNESVTKSQMALALLKKNPTAFYGNNINRMKAGVVLDLPTLAEITALTPQEASAEVIRQNEAWKNRGRKQEQVAAAPAKPAEKPAEKPATQAPAPEPKAAEPAASAEAPLLVVAQPEGGGAADAQALQELEDARLALEQELSSTQGEMSELKGENELLADRLGMVQEQLASIQETIDSKDQNIAALEAQLAQQRAQLSEAEKSLLDELMANPLYLAAAGGTLVALLAGLLAIMLLRRRKAKKAAEEAEAESMGLAPVAAAAAAGAATAALADDEPEEEAAEQAVPAADVAATEEIGELEGLEDLDLDMDLDLDLDEEDMLADTVAPAQPDAESPLEDEEFDLGLEEAAPEADTVEQIGGDDLEQMLVSELGDELGDELADSALELDSELSDDDLEFSRPSTVESSDELDDILNSEHDLDGEFSIDDLGIEFDEGEAETAAEAKPVADELEFDLESLSLESEAEEEVAQAEEPEIDDIDALLAQASADVDEADIEEPVEDVAIDDIDALLAEVSGAEEAPVEMPAEPEAESLEVDDIDALLAETEALAEPEADEEVQDEIALDLDDLLGPAEAAESAAPESEPELVPEETEQQQAIADADIDLMDELDLDLSDAALSLEEAEPEDLSGIDLEPAEETPEVDLSGLSLEEEIEPAAEPEEVPAPAPAPEQAFDAEVESLLEEVVAKTQTAAEAPEMAEEIAPEEMPATEEAEAEAPLLEMDDLDEIDLDLGDMDLDDLLEEAASEAEAEIQAPEAEEAPPEAGAEADLGLEGIEEDLDIADVMQELEAAGGMDVDELLLDESDLVGEEETAPKVKPGSEVEEELTANIAHDLDAELDSELQALLDGSDSEIELEESTADEEDLEELDGWALLEGADEVETKLDLARAYIDMDDAEGAREILKEIASEGSDKQKQEAFDLLGRLEKQ